MTTPDLSPPPNGRERFTIDIRRVLRASAEGRLAIIVAGVVVVCALFIIVLATKML